MALTYKDVDELNNAFNDVNQTLSSNRLTKAKAALQQQNQERLQQNQDQLNAYRQESLGQRSEQDSIMAELSQARLNETQNKDANSQKIQQQNADTNAEKGKKTYYFISPNTRNVQTFTGTPDEAQSRLNQLQQTTKNEQLSMTTSEPTQLKDLNPIQMPDGNTLYASDADALRYYQAKAAKSAPKPGSQTIRQTVNPAWTPDNGQPQFLSLTNTTTPIATSPAPLSGPAPAAQPNSPEAKAAKANQLAQQHPDWTREQIIQAVNGQ